MSSEKRAFDAKEAARRLKRSNPAEYERIRAIARQRAEQANAKPEADKPRKRGRPRTASRFEEFGEALLNPHDRVLFKKLTTRKRPERNSRGLLKRFGPVVYFPNVVRDAYESFDRRQWLEDAWKRARRSMTLYLKQTTRKALYKAAVDLYSLLRLMSPQDPLLQQPVTVEERADPDRDCRITGGCDVAKGRRTRLIEMERLCQELEGCRGTPRADEILAHLHHLATSEAAEEHQRKKQRKNRPCITCLKREIEKAISDLKREGWRERTCAEQVIARVLCVSTETLRARRGSR